MDFLYIALFVLLGAIAGYFLGYLRCRRRAEIIVHAGNYANAGLLLRCAEEIRRGETGPSLQLLDVLANTWIEEWKKRDYPPEEVSRILDMTPARELVKHYTAKS